jgi:hypothetical protein
MTYNIGIGIKINGNKTACLRYMIKEIHRLTFRAIAEEAIESQELKREWRMGKK